MAKTQCLQGQVERNTHLQTTVQGDFGLGQRLPHGLGQTLPGLQQRQSRVCIGRRLFCCGWQGKVGPLLEGLLVRLHFANQGSQHADHFQLDHRCLAVAAVHIEHHHIEASRAFGGVGRLHFKHQGVEQLLREAGRGTVG
ncbi:hypothetical protein D9M68_842340 [compost metagenome]